MNYTLHQLEIFLKVVELQSVTKASEELYMTQPAVSIQLKKFQDQFSIPLTEVVGRQIHVTEFGHEIAHIAQRVLDQLKEIQYKTEAYKGLLTGSLTISSASTGKYIIPYFISHFVHQHPGVDLVLDVTNKTQVIQSLKANKSDFVFVSVVPEDIEVLEELLVENKLFLFGSQKEDTPDAPLIYREEGSATRAAMEHFYTDKGTKKRKRLSLTSNEAVKQAVIAGLGRSIMPIIGLKNELHNNEIKIIKKPGLPIKSSWRLVWLKGKSLSPLAQAFLEFVKTHKDEVITEHFSWAEKY
jgi:DNA-binding transcriptional LysR family regulator